MRGGTSRGPFFLSSDLPLDIEMRDKILMSTMGVGNQLQIDGVGGGNPVTSKVAIVGPSSVENADVDYLFAQVRNDIAAVDTSPNCGNMLSAVGPFAIEAGLVKPISPVTLVRIHNVNTGERINAEIQVENNCVRYKGDASIAGVPGTAAPIYLSFLNAADADDATIFPTNSPINTINGIDVTCINCAMPMVLLRAQSLGLTGFETVDELNQNTNIKTQLEEIRMKAGELMGLGDVRDKVIPKPVLITQGNDGALLNVRYFMPHECHPSLATTGAVGIATACIKQGTIAHQITNQQDVACTIRLSHPSGEISVDIRKQGKKTIISILRTARRLFEGVIFANVNVPDAETKV